MSDATPRPRPRGPASCQARLSEADPRLYNTDRDFAHCFHIVMRRVFHLLQHKSFPEVEALLAQHQVPDQSLADAAEALAVFVSRQREAMVERRIKPGEGFELDLERAGWFETPEMARVAVLATMGIVTLGLHWRGVLEATCNGEGPAASLQTLAAEGQQVAELLALPRWRRRIKLWWCRVREALRALRG